MNSASATTQRGDIIAADGTRLADSLPLKGAANTYQREYPLGSLTAGVVGYYSPALDSSWGLEEQYNTTLTAHVQPPESLEQVLAPTTAADSDNKQAQHEANEFVVQVNALVQQLNKTIESINTPANN